ncbi:hypothetical protein NDU88_000710, partial [Pleurodeles waltl]
QKERKRQESPLGPRRTTDGYQEPEQDSSSEDLVVNLSHKQLSVHESRVLNRGLGFVPTPPEDPFRLNCELSQFFRKVRLHFFFQDRPEPSTINNTGLRKPSTFMPPANSLPCEVLAFEKAVLADLDQTIPKHQFINLPALEGEALKTLSNDLSIVIKPADKGG